MCFGHDGTAPLLRSLDDRGADRRTFLRGMLALGAGAAVVGGSALPATAGGASAAAAGRRVPRGLISIQLYTLRDAMTDWDSARKVLRHLADIGYPRVELAGLYDQSAKTVANFLRRQGISPTSSHVGHLGGRRRAGEEAEGRRDAGPRVHRGAVPRTPTTPTSGAPGRSR